MYRLDLPSLVRRVRDIGDFQNTAYHTDEMIMDRLNSHFVEVYRIYIDQDDGYFVREFDGIELLTLDQITLPEDFEKLYSLDKLYDNGYRPVLPLNYSEREQYQINSYEHRDFSLWRTMYYIQNNFIKLEPSYNISGVYRLKYYPSPPTIGSGLAELFREHDDYLIYRTIVDLRLKEEGEVQEFLVMANTALEDVKNYLANRSFDIPKKVADTYSTGHNSFFLWDNALSSAVPATRDAQPQLDPEVDEGVIVPFEVCLVFQDIPIVNALPDTGVNGFFNKDAVDFASVTLRIEDFNDEDILEIPLDTQNFETTLPLGQFYRDWETYELTVEARLPQANEDETQVDVKPFYVDAQYLPFDEISFNMIPVIAPSEGLVTETFMGLGGNPVPGINSDDTCFGVSFPNKVQKAEGETPVVRRISTEIFGGLEDERVGIFNSKNGQERGIQWVGIYTTGEGTMSSPTVRNFSIVYERDPTVTVDIDGDGNTERLTDTNVPDDFTVYLDDGSSVEFNITNNNQITATGVSPVVIEKNISINEATYNRLRGSSTWDLSFTSLKRNEWFLGQKFPIREFKEGEADNSERDIKVASLSKRTTDIRPTDSFHGDFLTKKREARTLRISPANLHHINWVTPKMELNYRGIYGIREINSRDLHAFSTVRGMKQLVVTETNELFINSYDNVNVLNFTDNKIIYHCPDQVIPGRAKFVVPRIYSRYSRPLPPELVGRLQMEFYDNDNDLFFTWVLNYGFEPLLQELFLGDQTTKTPTEATFIYTRDDPFADPEGGLETQAFISYYDTSGDRQIIRIVEEQARARFTNIDKARGIIVGIT